jgi:hemerythrin-like metal-binding protein
MSAFVHGGAGDGQGLIEVFPWSADFETGLPEVDGQHRRLVGLLNTLVGQLAVDGDSGSLGAVLEGLKDYTATHFRDEEALWLEYFAGDGWETGHHRTHGDFVGKVQVLLDEGASQPLELLVPEVVTFLTTWLAKHILEADKRLALVVLAMRAGMNRDAAKAHANALMGSGSRSLVETLMAMSEGIATRTVLLMQEVARRKQAEADLHAAHVALREASTSMEQFQRQCADARMLLSTASRALEDRPEQPLDEDSRAALVRMLRAALETLEAPGSRSR